MSYLILIRTPHTLYRKWKEDVVLEKDLRESKKKHLFPTAPPSSIALFFDDDDDDLLLIQVCHERRVKNIIPKPFYFCFTHSSPSFKPSPKKTPLPAPKFSSPAKSFSHT